MYNNMSYPYIPDPNLMNMDFSNKYSELEGYIRKLDREIKRLEHRVSVLERSKTPYVTTSQDDNQQDVDGMYMV